MAHRFIIDDQTGQLYKDFTGRRLTSSAELLKTERGLAPTLEIYLINVASDTGAVTGQTLTNNQLRVSIGNTSKPPEKGFLKAAFNVSGTLYESSDINIEGLTPSALESAFNTAVYPVYIAGGLTVDQIGEGKYLLTMKKVGAVSGVPTLDLDNAEPPSAVEVTQLKAASSSTKGQWVLSIAQQPVATITPGTFSVVNQGSSFNGFSKEISLNTTGMIAAIARGVRDFELSITHNNHQIHRSDISIHESLDPTSAGSLVITSPTLFTLGSHAVNQTETIAISGGLTYDGVTLAAPFLPLAGGTMSGAVAMGSQKITGLADGTASGDAVNKGQLDALVDSAPGALNTLNELAAALGDDANFSTTITNSIATKLPLAGGTMTGNAVFNDGVKAIFGTASDGIELYHQSNHSYLADTGTGALKILGSQIEINNAANSENIATFTQDGGAALFFNNSKKFETTADGIQVTGDILAYTDSGQYFQLDKSDNSLKLSDDVKLKLGTGMDLQMYHEGTNSYIANSVGDLIIYNSADDKDIFFQCDDGSGGLTTYFRLDGSFGGAGYPTTLFPNDSSLRFGNSGNLQIINNGTDSFIQENSGDLYIRQSTDDKDIIFQSDDGSGGVATYITIDGSAAYTKIHKNFLHLDSISSYYGNDADAYVRHTGTNLELINTTGDTIIRNDADDKDIIFQADDGSGGATVYFRLDGSSATHDGSASTSLYTNWPDNSLISLGTGKDFAMYHDGTKTLLNNTNGNLEIRNSADDSDIIFQSDDGSGGVETYFYLDGSASGGNPVTVFPDSSFLSFGTGFDFSIYHDSSNTYLANSTNDLYIQNNANDRDLFFRCDDGSGGVTTYFHLDGGLGYSVASKQITFQDSISAAFGTGNDLGIDHNGTDSRILNYTGDLLIQNSANDKDIIFSCDDGSGGTETYFFLDGSASSGNPITVFPDNSYLQFGSGLDLAIVHNGTNALISNTTGNIKFTNYADDADIIFECDDGSGGVTPYFRLDGDSGYTKAHKEIRMDDAIPLRIGTGGDARFMHDGANTYLDNYTGDFYIRQAAADKDIVFKADDGSGGNETYFYLDGSASSGSPFTVFPDNSKLTFGNSNDLILEHNGADSYISNYEGNLYIRNDATDKDIVFQTDDGSGGLAQYIAIDGSAGLTQFDKDTKYSDSKKAVFGNSGDLQIYHDGTHSKITNNIGTGSLYIQSHNTIQLESGNGEDMIFCAANGAVELYHDNVKKIETTSAGATVSGDLTVTGDMLLSGDTFTVDVGTLNVEDKNIILGNVSSPSDTTADGGGITLKGASDYTIQWTDATNRWQFNQGIQLDDGSRFVVGSLGDASYYHNGTDTYLENATGDLRIHNSADDKDILLICDDGAGGNATYIQLDGSVTRNKLLQHTSFPDGKNLIFGAGDDLQLYHGGSDSYIRNYTGSLFIKNEQDDGDIIFQCDDGSGGVTEYFRLDGGDTYVVFSRHTRNLDTMISSFGDSDDLRISHNGTSSEINNYTGNLFIRNYANDSDIIFDCDDGSGGTETYFFLDGSMNTDGTPKTVFPDNSKLQFGSGLADLRIYHNATDSVIENNTGDLYITNKADDKDIVFRSDDGSGGFETYFYLDGSATNIVFSKELRLLDGVQIQLGTGNDMQVTHNGATGTIQNATGDLAIKTLAADSDLEFYADDGSGSATKYFGLDGGLVITKFLKSTRHEDNVQLNLGTGNDLQLYHDGSNSYVTNATGDMYFINSADDKDISFQSDNGSGGFAEYFRVDGSEALTIFSYNTRHGDNVIARWGNSNDLNIYHDAGSNSIIQNETGHLDIKNDSNGSDIRFYCDDGSNGMDEYVRLDGGMFHTIFSKSTQHADGAYGKFGTGGDLQLSHNGTNSFIKNTNGDLYIENSADDKDIIFKCDDGSGGTETYFYLDGSASAGNPYTKFPDSSHLAFGDDGDFKIYHNGTNTFLENNTGDLYIQNGTDDKDIIFRCDDGSGGTETYFYLDGSLSSGNPFTIFPDNSRLGFGTGSDLYLFHNGTDSSMVVTNGDLYITNYANDKDIILQSDDGSGGSTTYLQCHGDRETVKHHRGVEYNTVLSNDSDYTVTSANHVVIFHDLSASRTLTIPTAQCNLGRVLIIKERDGYASSNNIVIDPEGSTTIDGAANYTISTNRGSVTLISDGSNWFVI